MKQKNYTILRFVAAGRKKLTLSRRVPLHTNTYIEMDLDFFCGPHELDEEQKSDVRYCLRIPHYDQLKLDQPPLIDVSLTHTHARTDPFK